MDVLLSALPSDLVVVPAPQPGCPCGELGFIPGAQSHPRLGQGGRELAAPLPPGQTPCKRESSVTVCSWLSLGVGGPSLPGVLLGATRSPAHPAKWAPDSLPISGLGVLVLTDFCLVSEQTDL